MRKRAFAIFTAVLLILSLSNTAVHAAKNPAAGAKCPKLKSTQVFQGKLYTCIKSKNKLVWNKGVAIKAAAVSPKASPSASQSATPSSSPSASASPTQNLLTMDKVRANNSPSSCWTVIDGYVYDLTKWINSHPGGPSAIRGLCGTDGTKSFKSQHESEAQAAQRLSLYLLGQLNG